MGTIYSKTERVVTTGPDEIVEIPFPSRCKIHRFNVYRPDGGAVDAELFSRALLSDDINVEKIVQTPDALTTRIILAKGSELPTHEGDPVVVDANAEGGYNTTHRVIGSGTLQESSNHHMQTSNLAFQQHYIDTDQTYSADGAGGTATITIPAAEEELYLVVGTLTGTPGIEVLTNVDADEIEYVNRDPIGNRNIGINRAMYIRLLAAATYLIQYQTEDIVGN